MKFIDKVPIAGTRLTADGYLVAEVKCARTGIQQYLASEIGLAQDGVVNVYRPEKTVFDKDSLATFAGKPVTLEHPPEAVTADNWKQYSVGDVGTEIARDGEFVKVPLKLMDAAAIKAVQDGTREISMGYTCGLKLEDGTAPDGTPYQAIQTGPLRINHLAVVSRARGGSQLRIGDSASSWGVSPSSQPQADERKSPMAENLRKVLVDGLQVETTDAGATAIDKLTKDKDALAVKLADAEKRAKEAEEEAEKKLAKKDAEIDALKGKVLDTAALDAAVQARGDLIAKAKTIAPDIKTDGLSDAAIRKAVVVAKLGDAMKDKGEAYIDARFDILAEDSAGTEQLRGALSSIKPAVNDASAYDKALNDSITNLNAHRYAKQ